MQYLVSKDNFTKITEPKGTIQNISKTLTIEVSETQTKNSGVLLPPMGKIQFDGSSVYARCVDGAGAEARVIPFEVVAKGGGGDGGVTADFSLDQAGTTIVENFRFSALEYPNATNPNLDGKTVLVMSVKDANATTSLVKYVFVDLAKLVGTTTLYEARDAAIGISGASIGLNLSASAGNILSVNDDGLYADLSVADGVSGNFAVIGESGAIVDGGFSFADLAELSAGKVFAGATSTAAGLSGLVPAPEAGDQTKFLRGDGTWAPVESGGASIAVFTGATSSTPGVIGYVPAPQAGDESKFLRGDGTWAKTSAGSVLDYSANTSGIREVISSNDNSIFGSEGSDYITVTGSYNKIHPGTQGTTLLSLSGSARENHIMTEGAGVDHYEDNRIFINGAASHNTICSRTLGKKFFYQISGDAKFNYIELTGAGEQEASIVGNGKYNRIKFVGITNGLACFGGNASLNCAEFTAGNNTAWVGTTPYRTTAGNILYCGAGNDTVYFMGAGLNTVVCGTGNASLFFRSRYASAEIQNFSNSDTLCFSGEDDTPATLQGSTVSGSTVKVQAVISKSDVNYSIPVTLSGGTATQYHLEFGENTADNGVYTVSGSQLVKAS